MTTQQLLDEIALVITTNGANDISGLKVRTLLNKLAQNLHNKESDAYPSSAALQDNSNTIKFVSDSFHGTKAAPLTGALTLDHTGAQLGKTAIIFHNGAVDPLAAITEKMTIVGTYQSNQLNVIAMCWASATCVLTTTNIEV